MAKQWEIFWEIPECPPFLTSEPARFFTKNLQEWCGENFKDCILEYRNNTNIWYLDGKQWSKLDQKLFQHILADPTFGHRMNQLSIDTCYPCFYFLDSLKSHHYQQLSDYELWKIHQQFMKIYIPAHASGHPANILEMKNQRLSGYLSGYLKKKAAGEEAFSLLTQPLQDMTPQRELKGLYALAKNPTEKNIRAHHQKYCWTAYNWEGPGFELEYYKEQLKSLQGKDPNDELQKINKEHKELSQRKQKLVTELDIDPHHQQLFRIASDIMFLKALRKDCMYKGAWASELLYQEIGRRLYLSTHQARFILYGEMEAALLRKEYNPQQIQERTKEVLLHQREGAEDIVLQGLDAMNFVKSLSIKKPNSTISELKGQCAFPGKVQGTIKYVNTPAMMEKMKQGDILLAYATQPNLLPAMKKAQAFITEFGGITCHAAIVAREWKIPCLIGVKDATKILKDGERVEVDATNGLVRKIR